MSELGVLRLNVRQDSRQFLEIDSPRPIVLQGNTNYTIHFTFQKINTTLVPPGYQAVSVAGLLGKLLLKRDVDDDDAGAVVNAALTLTDGPNGIMSVTFAAPDVEVNLGYGEIAVTEGGNPVTRVPFTYIIQRRGLALP